VLAVVTKSLRPVTRETSAIVRDKGARPVIVTVIGGVLELRAKGLRSTETLDLAWCYMAAVRQRLQVQKAERAKGRRRR
jgi:hypothetical protein